MGTTWYYVVRRIRYLRAGKMTTRRSRRTFESEEDARAYAAEIGPQCEDLVRVSATNARTWLK